MEENIMWCHSQKISQKLVFVLCLTFSCWAQIPIWNRNQLFPQKVIWILIPVLFYSICAWVLSCSVMSDSLQPRGKNTGVGCLSSSRWPFWPRDQTSPSPVSPALAGVFFTTEPPWKPILSVIPSKSLQLYDSFCWNKAFLFLYNIIFKKF